MKKSVKVAINEQEKAWFLEGLEHALDASHILKNYKPGEGANTPEFFRRIDRKLKMFIHATEPNFYQRGYIAGFEVSKTSPAYSKNLTEEQLKILDQIACQVMKVYEPKAELTFEY